MKTLVLTLAAAVALAGCGVGTRAAKPTVWLALEPPAVSAGLRNGGPSLEVATFASVPPFGTDRVVSREGGARWSFAAYHRWVAEPGEMVAARAREALAGAGLFSAVFTPPAPIDADYRLSGAVRDLSWDRGRAVATLEVEVSLVDNPGRLIAFRVYRAEAPVGAAGVDAFLAAAAAALGTVLGELRGDLSRLVVAGAGQGW